MVYFLRYETLNIKINGNIRLLDLSLKALRQPKILAKNSNTLFF